MVPESCQIIQDRIVLPVLIHFQWLHQSIAQTVFWDGIAHVPRAASGPQPSQHSPLDFAALRDLAVIAGLFAL